MKAVLIPYSEGFSVTGILLDDITTFFQLHNDARTLEHTLKVANEAQRIAELYKLESMNVVNAALLHDISNVIPISKMLYIAEELSIKILEEELKYSRSVHQKLSKEMAEEIFRISEYEILSSIESHTTHKSKASLVDKILFVSDKISWDLPGEHPHLQEMRKKVDELEIDKAILIYLNSIWVQRDKLKLVHPWLIEAREELMQIYQ